MFTRWLTFCCLKWVYIAGLKTQQPKLPLSHFRSLDISSDGSNRPAWGKLQGAELRSEPDQLDSDGVHLWYMLSIPNPDNPNPKGSQIWSFFLAPAWCHKWIVTLVLSCGMVGSSWNAGTLTVLCKVIYVTLCVKCLWNRWFLSLDKKASEACRMHSVKETGW